jgi:predicted metal-dependent peptidase
MARSDYTWTRSDRRFVAGGLYLPDLHSEGCPPLVVAFDTSASVDNNALDEFVAELNSILEDLAPEKVILIQADSIVQGVETYGPQDLPIKPDILGRGGTWFDPVFQWVLDNEDETGQIGGLIYFTDMDCHQVREDLEPDYPVLWADYGDSTFNNMDQFYYQRFGERVVLKDTPTVAPGY